MKKAVPRPLQAARHRVLVEKHRSFKSSCATRYSVELEMGLDLKVHERSFIQNNHLVLLSNNRAKDRES